MKFIILILSFFLFSVSSYSQDNTQSDVEFTNNTDNVKTVYQNKAVTDIRKLVTEGYIKIERQTQDVEIATEKATL